MHLHWTFGTDPSNRYASHGGQGTFNRSTTQGMHILEDKKHTDKYKLHLRQYIKNKSTKWRKEYVN